LAKPHTTQTTSEDLTLSVINDQKRGKDTLAKNEKSFEDADAL